MFCRDENKIRCLRLFRCALFTCAILISPHVTAATQLDAETKSIIVLLKASEWDKARDRLLAQQKSVKTAMNYYLTAIAYAHLGNFTSVAQYCKLALDFQPSLEQPYRDAAWKLYGEAVGTADAREVVVVQYTMSASDKRRKKTIEAKDTNTSTSLGSPIADEARKRIRDYDLLLQQSQSQADTPERQRAVIEGAIQKEYDSTLTGPSDVPIPPVDLGEKSTRVNRH